MRTDAVASRPSDLSLGGLTFRLPSSVRHLLARNPERIILPRFLVTGGEAPDFEIVCRPVDPASFAQPGVRAGIDWEYFPLPRRLALAFGRRDPRLLEWPIDGPRVSLASRLTPDGSWADGDGEARAALSALRFLLPFALALREGIFLHGAAVVLDGQAVLFAGPSGAGKSTIAGLLEQAGGQVLSDERPIVRRGSDGGFLSYGSPWPSSGSHYAQPEGAPLAALCLLEHGTEDTLDPLTPGEAFARLRADRLFFFPHYAPTFFQPLMATWERLLRQTPLYRLRFRPTTAVAARLRAHLARTTAIGRS